jgi:hypothetical protein
MGCLRAGMVVAIMMFSIRRSSSLCHERKIRYSPLMPICLRAGPQ